VIERCINDCTCHGPPLIYNEQPKANKQAVTRWYLVHRGCEGCVLSCTSINPPWVGHVTQICLCTRLYLAPGCALQMHWSIHWDCASVNRMGTPGSALFTQAHLLSVPRFVPCRLRRDIGNLNVALKSQPEHPQKCFYLSVNPSVFWFCTFAHPEDCFT